MTRPSCFPLPLLGEWDEGTYRLTETFLFIGNNEVVEVPAGFETDFASIPQLFHNLLSPQGRYGWAAVIHDFCYRTGYKSKPVSDAIFKEAMDESGVPVWQKWTCYLAVRFFGGKSYKGKKKP